MYQRGKYVVGEVQGQMVAVAFPETVEHTAMSRIFDQGSLRSAGFFQVGVFESGGETDVSPYGEASG